MAFTTLDLYQEWAVHNPLRPKIRNAESKSHSVPSLCSGRTVREQVCKELPGNRFRKILLEAELYAYQPMSKRVYNDPSPSKVP